jgi:hypothetical protein
MKEWRKRKRERERERERESESERKRERERGFAISAVEAEDGNLDVSLEPCN